MEFKITNKFGQALTLSPRLGLYTVKDFMGEKLPGLGIILDDVTNPAEPEQYAVLTVSFGEFIGSKNCAYIDVNNCYFANQLLIQGFGKDTGFSKTSGYCDYPLWQFDESTLREIGNDAYQKYSDAYDNYMESFNDDEPDEDDTPQMTM